QKQAGRGIQPHVAPEPKLSRSEHGLGKPEHGRRQRRDEQQRPRVRTQALQYEARTHERRQQHQSKGIHKVRLSGDDSRCVSLTSSVAKYQRKKSIVAMKMPSWVSCMAKDPCCSSLNSSSAIEFSIRRTPTIWLNGAGALASTRRPKSSPAMAMATM